MDTSFFSRKGIDLEDSDHAMVPYLTVTIESELLSLLGTFLKRRRLEIEFLKELILKENLSEIQKIGHDLKGVPGAFGYHYLVEIGARLENSAAGKDLTGLNLALTDYELFMDRHSIQIEGEERVYYERDFVS